MSDRGKRRILVATERTLLFEAGIAIIAMYFLIGVEFNCREYCPRAFN